MFWNASSHYQKMPTFGEFLALSYYRGTRAENQHSKLLLPLRPHQ